MPGPQLDRQRGDVGELERDVAGEAGVDEAGGGVGDQTQPSQARLALEPRRHVVRQGHDLVGGRQDELPRVQDERLALLDLDQPGELGLLLRGVDHGVLVVVEQPEQPVDPDVDAGRLDHRRVVGLQHHPSGLELGADVAVGEQHAGRLPGPAHGRPTTGRGRGTFVGAPHVHGTTNSRRDRRCRDRRLDLQPRGTGPAARHRRRRSPMVLVVVTGMLLAILCATTPMVAARA